MNLWSRAALVLVVCGLASIASAQDDEVPGAPHTPEPPIEPLAVDGYTPPTDDADRLAAPTVEPSAEPTTAPSPSTEPSPPLADPSVRAVTPYDSTGPRAYSPEPEPSLEPVAPPPYGGRAYVIRYARRPLTLGEGVLRIDHGSSGRLGGLGSFGIVMAMTEGLHVGAMDDLEVGVSLSQVAGNAPGVRDPWLDATYRFYHDDVVELGVRAAVRIPMITTGDTVLRLGLPMVVHADDWFRVSTAIELDLLFASNVSPLLSVPLQVAFSPSNRFSLGAEGWFGLLDGRDALGSVGAFAQVTGHTPVRALWDVRFAAAYLIRESAMQITTAVSFYPQLW